MVAQKLNVVLDVMCMRYDIKKPTEASVFIYV